VEHLVHPWRGSTQPGDPEEDGRKQGAKIDKVLSGLEGREDDMINTGIIVQ
jgi:hypothetical protein